MRRSKRKYEYIVARGTSVLNYLHVDQFTYAQNEDVVEIKV